MFRIKAIAALALAGLGGATLGTDAYLASRAPAAHGYQLPSYEVPKPAPAVVDRAPALQDSSSSVVMLTPTTITSRVPARHRAAMPAARETRQEFVPCSNWRSLETGPSDRGVRTLCVRNVPAEAAE